jgi:putative Holliday junction resolvase
MGWTAQGLAMIPEKNQQKLIERLVVIINENKVEKVVVGLPKNMNGTIGERGKITLEFIENLKKSMDIEIIIWDERLSTVAAHRTLNEVNIRGKKRKQLVDTVAAVYILQGYLNSIYRDVPFL